MADVDNTFTSSKLINISQCHSSYGKNNQLAKPKLDRWKDLNNAIIDWMNNDAIEETSVRIAEQNNFQFYDKIQKSILSDLFARFRSIYPKKGAEFNHDFPIKEVTRVINGEEYALTTYFTYEFSQEGLSEYIKLKTAFDPKPELIDKAIITKLKEENEEFYIASLEREDLEEIEIIENADEVIDQHFNILENFLNNKQKRNPGDWCNIGCDMASRCGQFPLVNIDKLTNRIREVKISKTNALKLQQCERRAAWNTQYGIPKENYSEYTTESLGTKFHNYSQKMLVGNQNFKNKNNIEDFKSLTKNEETINRKILFKKYEELVQNLKPYDNLSINKAEYNLGFTVVAEGKGIKQGNVVEQKVATIFMGRTDLIGRKDGKPFIIELKTRPELDEDFLEAQLYALGASKLDNADEVTVLHIYLTDNETRLKERVFSQSELEEAEKRYLKLATKSASWIPNNALSVNFNVGDWCEKCEFKNTCSQNRINPEQVEIISLEKELAQKKEDFEKEFKRIKKDEKIISDLKKEWQQQANEIQKQQEFERSELIKLKIEIEEARELLNDLIDEENLEKLEKEYKEKKEFYFKESEKIENELVELEREKNIMQEAKNTIEQFAKESTNTLHPNLVFMNLRDNILLQSLRVIHRSSGYGSDVKLLELDELLFKNTIDWRHLRGSKPKMPFSDLRYMIKVLEYSNKFLHYEKRFNYIKQQQRNYLIKLKKRLNFYAHQSIPIYTKNDIKDLGGSILSFLNSFLASGYFTGDVKNELLIYQSEVKNILDVIEGN